MLSASHMISAHHVRHAEGPGASGWDLTARIRTRVSIGLVISDTYSTLHSGGCLVHTKLARGNPRTAASRLDVSGNGVFHPVPREWSGFLLLSRDFRRFLQDIPFVITTKQAIQILASPQAC